MRKIRMKWLKFVTISIQRLVIKLEDMGWIEPDENEEILYRKAVNNTYGGNE